MFALAPQNQMPHLRGRAHCVMETTAAIRTADTDCSIEGKGAAFFGKLCGKADASLG